MIVKRIFVTMSSTIAYPMASAGMPQAGTWRSDAATVALWQSGGSAPQAVSAGVGASLVRDCHKRKHPAKLAG
jgi:hypothetical protein